MADMMKKIIPILIGLCFALCMHADEVELYFFINGELQHTERHVTKNASFNTTTVTSDLEDKLEGCRGYTFAGWKIGGAVEPGETPALITTESPSFTPDANTMLTAVFQKTGAATNRFRRITSTSDLEANAKYLIVCFYDHDGDIYYGPQYYAMNSTNGSYSSGKSLGATQIFPEAGVYDNTNDAITWTLSGSEGAWRWKNDNNNYYLDVDASNYTLLPSSDYGTTYDISAIRGVFSIYSSYGYYLSYSDDDNDYFKSASSNSWTFYLYKKEASYTSYPNCSSLWSVIFDAVEGTIKSKTPVSALDTLTQANADAGVNVSTKEAVPPCEGWTFSGWHVDEPIRGQESPSRGHANVPDLKKTGSYVPHYDEEILYAIYETTGYERITSSSQLSAGDTCVLVYTGNKMAITDPSSNNQWAGTPITLSGDEKSISAGVIDATKWTYSGTYFYNITDNEYHRLSWNGGTDQLYIPVSAGSNTFKLQNSNYSYSNYRLRWNDSYFRESTNDDQNQFYIYKKKTTYTSYPHCSTYTTILHACGGTVDGKASVPYDEDGASLGFSLPGAIPQCPDSGWVFAGWAEGGDIGSYKDVKFDDIYKENETFYPKHDGTHLYAVYRRLTERFRIFSYGTAAGLELPVPGDNYLITYYDVSSKIDYELSSVYHTQNSKLSAVEGHSPPMDDSGFYLEQQDTALWWTVDGSVDAWTFKNVHTESYLNIGDGTSTLGSSQTFTIIPNANVSASGNRNVSIRSNTNSKYLRYTSGYFHGGNSENFNYNGSQYNYASQCYLYRQIKEYTSWPHCAGFTVFFDGVGGSAEASELTEDRAYAGIILPNASAGDCARDGWTLAGWAEEKMDYEQSTLDRDLYPANTIFNPTKDSMTLFAVYCIKENTYKKITSMDELFLGVNYIVSYNTNALKNSASGGKIQSQSISSGTTITIANASAIEWTLTGEKGEYVFFNTAKEDTIYWDLTTEEAGKLTIEPDVDNFYIKQTASSQFTIRSNKSEAGFKGKMTLDYSSGFYTSENGGRMYLFQQQAIYNSNPNCATSVDAVLWAKEDDRFYVYVESYLDGDAPIMNRADGSPVLLTEGEMQGTWKIPYDTAVLKSCTETAFRWNNEDAILKIPYVVYKDTSVSALSADCSECDVVVHDGATLTINASRTIHSLTIYDGGKLVVDDGVTLNVNSLILSSDMKFDPAFQKAPSIVMNGSGAIVLNFKDLYHDMRLDDSRYYFFSMPYDVDKASITYANVAANGGIAPRFRTDYWVKYYDGVGRSNDANNGTRRKTYWTNMTDANLPFTLKAGQGYEIGITDQTDSIQPDGHKHAKRVMRFIMTPSSDWNTKEKDYKKATHVSPSIAVDPRNYPHIGWNLIGNPYLQAYKAGSENSNSGMQNGAWRKVIVDGTPNGDYYILDGDSLDVPYLTIYNPSTKTYKQRLARTYGKLRPFEAVFVQINSGDMIYFKQDTIQRTNAAPARSRFSVQDMPVRTGVTLSGVGQTDETGVVLFEDYTNEYEIGSDLYKEVNKGLLNLYTINKYDQPLAFNSLSEDDALNPIPMGVSFPAAGEYTFAFDNAQYETYLLDTLMLIDYSTGVSTNLLYNAYTFTSEAGTMDNRFALFITLAKSPQISTEINNTYEPGQPRKIIRDGQLFILVNDEMYNAVGTRVR